MRMSLRYALIRSAFEALALSHLTGLIRARSSCLGVIFTLHRVLPETPAEFSPNAILQVTPDYLAYAINRVRELGFEIVTLDEAIRRVESGRKGPPFAVFTFDDGYRDNLFHALPILRELDCPFTLYVPTAFIDGIGEIWWQALEDIIAQREAMMVTHAGTQDFYDLATVPQKRQAYDTLYWRMRRMPEAERVAFIHELAEQHDYDLEQQCRRLIMGWSELQRVASESLCTIGAHTVHHYELAKLPAEQVRSEIGESLNVLRAQLGIAPQHLSYPIGGAASAGPREFAIAAELGLRSSVTTRLGGLYASDKDNLQSLPRISLNGLFQARRYVDVFATGAVFSKLSEI